MSYHIPILYNNPVAASRSSVQNPSRNVVRIWCQLNQERRFVSRVKNVAINEREERLLQHPPHPSSSSSLQWRNRHRLPISCSSGHIWSRRIPPPTIHNAWKQGLGRLYFTFNSLNPHTDCSAALRKDARTVENEIDSKLLLLARYGSSGFEEEEDEPIE